jgi:hypothetical protein
MAGHPCPHCTHADIPSQITWEFAGEWRDIPALIALTLMVRPCLRSKTSMVSWLLLTTTRSCTRRPGQRQSARRITPENHPIRVSFNCRQGSMIIVVAQHPDARRALAPSISMRRSFRAHGLAVKLTPGPCPGLVCYAPLGHSWIPAARERATPPAIPPLKRVTSRPHRPRPVLCWDGIPRRRRGGTARSIPQLRKRDRKMLPKTTCNWHAPDLLFCATGTTSAATSCITNQLQKWRPLRESNPYYNRERVVS